MKKHFQQYLTRHAYAPPQLSTAPALDLRRCVIIPCHDEPDLLHTLDTLWHCDRPDRGSTEIIIVVNAASDSSPQTQATNAQTLREIEQWSRSHQDSTLQVHTLHYPTLRPKHAGVGLARKLGMDEALSRFAQLDRPDGLLINLDADCAVESNYLCAIEEHFTQRPESTGATLYFEHPLATLPAQHREAMASYELHMRCYINGLRYAHVPYQFYAIGSCLAVRAHTYQQLGGMNKRKAGEDFYFLQKIVTTGRCSEINATCVRPSARLSERVPFGTGRAVAAQLPSHQTQTPQTTYALAGFTALRQLMCTLRDLYDANTTQRFHAWETQQHPLMQQYLVHVQWAHTQREIRDKTSNRASFLKRCHHWCNAFWIMKFLHFVRTQGHPDIPVLDAAQELWDALEARRTLLPLDALHTQSARSEAERWLYRFRAIDRKYQVPPSPL